MAGRRDNGDRLSIQTLVIASLASATAAVVVSQFWKSGTVISAAITPVVVTIVSELLHRPARAATRLTAAAPQPESSEPSTAGLERLAAEIGTAPGGAAPPDGPRPGGMRVYQKPRRPLHLKLALGTGLLAFVIAGLFLTVPELIAGGQALGDRGTTLFGGGGDGNGRQQREQEEQPQETTPQPTAPEEEQTAPPPTTTEQEPPAQPPQTEPPAQPPPAQEQPAPGNSAPAP